MKVTTKALLIILALCSVNCVRIHAGNEIFKKGQMISLESNRYKDVYLLIDGSTCIDNGYCGTVSAQFRKSGQLVKGINILPQQVDEEGNYFCFECGTTKSVYLSVKTECSKTETGGANGCGVVSPRKDTTKSACFNNRFLVIYHKGGLISLVWRESGSSLRLNGKEASAAAKSKEGGYGQVNLNKNAKVKELPTESLEIFKVSTDLVVGKQLQKNNSLTTKE